MLMDLFKAGLLSLEDYILAHTLTCLIPAFLLAGAIVTFINREAVILHLGENANMFKAFSLAAVSSFLLAACSCTVIPVASGLYFAGAGVGVAFIILWVAPAANILALVYTGSILGADIVLVRIASALIIAFVVGFVMRSVFGNNKRDEQYEPPAIDIPKQTIIGNIELGLITVILLSLLLPNYLVQEGPYLLKILVWGISTIAMIFYAATLLDREKIVLWLQETWWFVKIIFPLLLGGVFLVGIIGALLPEQWVQHWLGNNTMLASFLATLIGAVSYFATMTEAPFVDMLLGLGMGMGPAITLLLVGPGISLPNWLAIARVFGIKKALVYVPVIIIAGTLAGWFFGNFIL